MFNKGTTTCANNVPADATAIGTPTGDYNNNRSIDGNNENNVNNNGDDDTGEKKDDDDVMEGDEYDKEDGKKNNGGNKRRRKDEDDGTKNHDKYDFDKIQTFHVKIPESKNIFTILWKLTDTMFNAMDNGERLVILPSNNRTVPQPALINSIAEFSSKASGITQFFYVTNLDRNNGRDKIDGLKLKST